jgi:hypothetical protein
MVYQKDDCIDILEKWSYVLFYLTIFLTQKTVGEEIPKVRTFY